MKGKWKNLIIKTFSCQPKTVEQYLPKDVVLDLYEDKALFSMVAFTFSSVHFFGIKIPFHQRFGEINFRVYVKSKINGRKGVVFLKEYAPKPIIVLIAKYIYNEPFYFHKIKQEIKLEKSIKNINYSFKLNNKNNYIKATVNLKELKTSNNFLQNFIVDRYIAFVKGKKTLEYQILHKPWKIYKTIETNISNEVLNLLPKQFKKSEELNTYVVNGSSIKIKKGILNE